MLELARRGAGWLCEYEGWGVGTNTLVVDEGHEPPELLRHLNRPAKDAREVSEFRYFLGLPILSADQTFLAQ